MLRSFLHWAILILGHQLAGDEYLSRCRARGRTLFRDATAPRNLSRIRSRHHCGTDSVESALALRQVVTYARNKSQNEAQRNDGNKNRGCGVTQYLEELTNTAELYLPPRSIIADVMPLEAEFVIASLLRHER